MKKIIVHGWAQDNAGSYHKPGASITVDDEGGEGCIGEKRATELIKLGAASADQGEKADNKAAAK